MAKQLSPALSHEALFNKSKTYIQRGLRAKQDGNLPEYQLWASIALELLGKAALADIHPSLVADPQSIDSLLVAAGIPVTTNVKTISAHTVFQRLGKVAKRFDEVTHKFCKDLSERRNAELHSAELPFHEMPVEAWEGHFWHACDVILDKMNSTLDDWLGAHEAKTPKDLLKHAKEANWQAAQMNVERVREAFESKYNKQQRQNLLMQAESLSPWLKIEQFRIYHDYHWETHCPSCTSKAFLGGYLWEEYVSDEQDSEDPWSEYVDRLFTAEEFVCPTCQLRIEGVQGLEAVGLDTNFEEHEIRERQYEPEYGNE